MVSEDERRSAAHPFTSPSCPWSCQLFFFLIFCVYLSYADELLCDITRADCLKVSGMDPSQCLISSFETSPPELP